jgi:hypothetical protein
MVGLAIRSAMFMAFLEANTQQLPCLFLSNVSTIVKPFRNRRLTASRDLGPAGARVRAETKMPQWHHTRAQRCLYSQGEPNDLSAPGSLAAGRRRRGRTRGRGSRSRRGCRTPGGSRRRRSAHRCRTAEVPPDERTPRRAGSPGAPRWLPGGTTGMLKEGLPSSDPRGRIGNEPTTLPRRKWDARWIDERSATV